MARTVACALVTTRLDYANSVLYGTSAANIVKLQRVRNALARVVTYKKRTDHIRPVPKKPSLAADKLPHRLQRGFTCLQGTVNRQPNLSPSVGQRLHAYQLNRSRRRLG